MTMTVIERAPGSMAEAGSAALAHDLGDSAMVERRQPTVLVFGTDSDRRDQIVSIIEEASWLPLVAGDRSEVLRIVQGAPPDLFVLVLAGFDGVELELLDDVRNSVDGELVPIVCVLDQRHRDLTIDAFGRRADDVVCGRPHPSELIARLRARIERRPVPTTELIEDPVTGALTPRAFATQLSKEHERVARGGEPGALAFLSLDELPGITARRGSRARDELLAQVVRLIEHDGRQLDFVGSRRGVLALLLPGTPTKGAQARLDRLARKIYDHDFSIDDSTIALTPILGFTESTPDAPPRELEDRAWDAMSYQAAHLDLHPTRWVAAMSPKPTQPGSRRHRAFERVRTPVQVVAQQLIALLFPLASYALLDRLGLDITGVVYLMLVGALAITAAGILIESRAAIPPTVPPDHREGPLPPASAIIAAYLPNEAETVLDTIDAFLALDYPGLEIILAYNTPQTLPVEAELARIADRDPRFRPLRVQGSASKAQNVNAALAHIRGHFVGLFDADHHPAPGSFQRAWQWIDDGAGVVQGHCVIRNGDLNAVTRTVAVEFESIYAVSHPGRARVHGFGIFGGSNGYWRTSLLHRTRMRGSMLTEDIDSSMRVVTEGETIISDPDLVSTELAPETLGALWNQRLRWAQGWSQVSLRHLVSMLRAAPTWRRRAGVFYLLGWREIYPWISLQVYPLLAYWWIRGTAATDWFVPIFVGTTIFTLSVGPAQTWFAYRLAHPTIKMRRRWFLKYLLLSTLFYTEFKNVTARTAQIKEAMRERKWKVTPRTGSVAIDAGAALEPEPGPTPTSATSDDTPTGSDHLPHTSAPDTASVVAGHDQDTPTVADGTNVETAVPRERAHPRGTRRGRSRRHASRPRRHGDRPARPMPSGASASGRGSDTDHESPDGPGPRRVEGAGDDRRHIADVDSEPLRSVSTTAAGIYDIERESIADERPSPPPHATTAPSSIYDVEHESSIEATPTTGNGDPTPDLRIYDIERESIADERPSPPPHATTAPSRIYDVEHESSIEATPTTGNGDPTPDLRIYDIERESIADERPSPPPHATTAPSRIYDVEHESSIEATPTTGNGDPTPDLRIYDIERESIADERPSPPPEPLPGARPLDDAVAPAADPRPGVAEPMDPTAAEARRPMIAGVDGVLIVPTRRTGPWRDQDRTARAPGAGGAPMLAVTSSTMAGGQDGGDLIFGESIDLEALRPRRPAADQPDLSGA